MDQWAATFKDFPPVQHPNSFTIDEALKMLSSAASAPQ
jgi:arylsulfatase